MIREKCKALGIPVVYTAQPGGKTLEQGGLLQDFLGDGVPVEPDKKKIVDELTPDEDDIYLTKWRYSAFEKTNLLEILNEQGRDQLIICCIYAHVGCLLTACEVFMDGIEPFFIADAVADFSPDHHKQALEYASNRCAVTKTKELLLKDLYKLKKDSSEFTLQNLRQGVADFLEEWPSTLFDEKILLNGGLDSIKIMSFVEILRQRGLEVTYIDSAESPTSNDWWELIFLK